MEPTVAVCQIQVDDLDTAANVDTVASRLEDLPARVDVALFPELGLTGFVADERLGDVALARDGSVLDRLRALATTHETALVAGFAEAAGETLYNTTAYLSSDGAATYYRKRHLWGGERTVFAAGDDRVVVDTPVGRTGLVTCYDLNFVHDSAAFLEAGVDTLFAVGAWPATHAPNWRLLVRGRALDGVRWVVACGRTGRRELSGAPTVEYAGRSLVARPDGAVAAGLAHSPDELVVPLDPEILARQRDLVGISVPDVSE